VRRSLPMTSVRCSERQVRRHDQARALASVDHDLEEQFRPGPGERDVAEFVDGDQMRSLQLTILPLLKQLGHQGP